MSDIYLSWGSDIETRLRVATAGNKPEEVRKLSFAVQKANMVLESWLLTSGGKLVGYDGNVGTASMSPEHLGDLPRLREQYETAVEGRCFMGVGTEMSEARMALDVARGRGGQHAIVFYTEEVAEEASALQQQQAATEGNSFELGDEDAAALEQPLGKSFGAEPDAGEATAIANGTMSPDAAQPSPLPMRGASALPSAGAGEVQASQEGQGSEQPPAPAAGAPTPPPSDKLKEEVVGVLRDIRAQTPTFEKLKEENPDAYEAVMNLVEAMLAMAKQLLGTQPGQTMSKEELEAAEAPPEDGSPVSDTKLNKDAMPDAPAAHHHLQLPVGSTHNGRVRVVHQDGQSQWVSVRAGQIQVDNHTKSSRAPDDHHVKSGEEDANPLEAQARGQ